MPAPWSWNEAGEPVLGIGMDGYEATPIRTTDVLAWCEMSPCWARSPPEAQEQFKDFQADFLAKAIQAAQPFIDAFRLGIPVEGTPIWVARDVTNNGKAVCRLVFNDPENNDTGTRDVGWYTHPDYRRRGIAKALVKTVLEEFAGKVMKLRDVTADCEESNEASIRLLRSIGFLERGASKYSSDAGRYLAYIKVLGTPS